MVLFELRYDSGLLWTFISTLWFMDSWIHISYNLMLCDFFLFIFSYIWNIDIIYVDVVDEGEFGLCQSACLNLMWRTTLQT